MSTLSSSTIPRFFNHIYRRFKHRRLFAPSPSPGSTSGATTLPLSTSSSTSSSSSLSTSSTSKHRHKQTASALYKSSDHSTKSTSSQHRTSRSLLKLIRNAFLIILLISASFVLYAYILYLKYTNSLSPDDAAPPSDDLTLRPHQRPQGDDDALQRQRKAFNQQKLLKQHHHQQQQSIAQQRENLHAELTQWRLPLVLTKPSLPTLYNETEIGVGRSKWPRRVIDRGSGYEPELWQTFKDDVAICVKTGSEVSAERLEHLRTMGWWSTGRDIPNLIVVSDNVQAYPYGIVSVRRYGLDLLQAFSEGAGAAFNASAHLFGLRNWFAKAGWKGDKDKNLPALHLLYSVFPNKKFYLLLDDDTYVFLENFATYLHDLSNPSLRDQSAPLYTGKTFFISRCGGFTREGTNLTNTEDKGMFAHGGSGILLNDVAMRTMYPAIPHCIYDFNSCWAGDMQVGLCLRRVGIKVKRFTSKKYFELNFIPFSPSKALADRRYTSRFNYNKYFPITFHKLQERELQLVSQFEKLAIRRRVRVGFKNLRIHLMDNGILPAHAPKDRKGRWFTNAFLPQHLK